MLSQISESDTVSTRVTVDSEYGEFTFECENTGDATSVSVLSPEIISGVTAKVTDEGFDLEYDGIILDLGVFGEDGISPVCAVPCVIAALRRGWYTSVWREECLGTECIAAAFQISESTSATVWLDPDTGSPIYAELDSNGVVILSCTVESWIRG
jgi:hypothetical protein